MEKFFKAWVDEKARADQLIVDLGRRTAEERIARLILNLVDRLAKRDMVRGEPDRSSSFRCGSITSPTRPD